MMDGMDGMMAGMGLMWLLGLALLFAIVVAGVYLGVRAARARVDQGEVSARALLERRLAAGEIDADEYYERESVLRAGGPRGAHRRA
jgi:uncharacterized membrane protein